MRHDEVVWALAVLEMGDSLNGSSVVHHIISAVLLNAAGDVVYDLLVLLSKMIKALLLVLVKDGSDSDGFPNSA